MNRTVLLLLAVVLAPAILGAAYLAVVLVSVIRDGGMRKLAVNGVERTYYLYVPDQLPSGAPLVIMLHGYGSDGRTVVRDFGWQIEADLGRFAVAGPDASRTFPGATPDRRNRRSWNAGVAGEAGGVEHSDDVSFIVAVIDDLARNVGIDRRRVYVAGFSSGGQMASRLGQEIADRLAAISMSASQVVIFPRPPSRGVPILFSAGDLDPVTPVEGSRVELPTGGFYVREAHRTLVDRWRMLDGCPAAHRVPGPKNTIIEVSAPCRNGSEVRYVLMQGVAHEWPMNHPVNLTRMSWEFFRRFSLPAQVEGN
jgi:polyhydroxybutyrate depolymerase